METPAPLFSLSEAEATVQPGRTQGRRGLPPLARALRKRSQVREAPLGKSFLSVSAAGHFRLGGGCAEGWLHAGQRRSIPYMAAADGCAPQGSSGRAAARASTYLLCRLLLLEERRLPRARGDFAR